MGPGNKWAVVVVRDHHPDPCFLRERIQVRWHAFVLGLRAVVGQEVIECITTRRAVRLQFQKSQTHAPIRIVMTDLAGDVS